MSSSINVIFKFQQKWETTPYMFGYIKPQRNGIDAEL